MTLLLLDISELVQKKTLQLPSYSARIEREALNGNKYGNLGLELAGVEIGYFICYEFYFKN